MSRGILRRSLVLFPAGAVTLAVLQGCGLAGQHGSVPSLDRATPAGAEEPAVPSGSADAGYTKLDPDVLARAPLSTSISPDAAASPWAAPSIADLPAPVEPQPGDGNDVLPLLGNPLPGDFPLGNFFDHDLPFEFRDANAYQLTWWGERTGGVNGHNGYDWLTPVGTPVLAAADGIVVRAGFAQPFECALLRRVVSDSLGVEILHHGPKGERLISNSSHLERVDVREGQQVRRGQQIGLTGASGCANTPHLHFQVRREKGTNNGGAAPVDPYGWDAQQPDPWRKHPEGAPSPWLWREGGAPKIYREERRSPSPPGEALPPVLITILRWMGWRDADHPGNEFIQVELNPQAAPAGFIDLSGYRIETNRGEVFQFPNGLVLSSGRPVRVFAGPGRDSDSELHWGGRGNIWDPMGDCARLLDPGNHLVDSMSYLGAPCAPLAH